MRKLEKVKLEIERRMLTQDKGSKQRSYEGDSEGSSTSSRNTRTEGPESVPAIPRLGLKSCNACTGDGGSTEPSASAGAVTSSLPPSASGVDYIRGGGNVIDHSDDASTARNFANELHSLPVTDNNYYINGSKPNTNYLHKTDLQYIKCASNKSYPSSSSVTPPSSELSGDVGNVLPSSAGKDISDNQNIDSNFANLNCVLDNKNRFAQNDVENIVPNDSRSIYQSNYKTCAGNIVPNRAYQSSDKSCALSDQHTFDANQSIAVEESGPTAFSPIVAVTSEAEHFNAYFPHNFHGTNNFMNDNNFPLMTSTVRGGLRRIADPELIAYEDSKKSITVGENCSESVAPQVVRRPTDNFHKEHDLTRTIEVASESSAAPADIDITLPEARNSSTDAEHTKSDVGALITTVTFDDTRHSTGHSETAPSGRLEISEAQGGPDRNLVLGLLHGGPGRTSTAKPSERQLNFKNTCEFGQMYPSTERNALTDACVQTGDSLLHKFVDCRLPCDVEVIDAFNNNCSSMDIHGDSARNDVRESIPCNNSDLSSVSRTIETNRPWLYETATNLARGKEINFTSDKEYNIPQNIFRNLPHAPTSSGNVIASRDAELNLNNAFEDENENCLLDQQKASDSGKAKTQSLRTLPASKREAKFGTPMSRLELPNLTVSSAGSSDRADAASAFCPCRPRGFQSHVETRLLRRQQRAAAASSTAVTSDTAPTGAAVSMAAASPARIGSYLTPRMSGARQPYNGCPPLYEASTAGGADGREGAGHTQPPGVTRSAPEEHSLRTIPAREEQSLQVSNLTAIFAVPMSKCSGNNS